MKENLTIKEELLTLSPAVANQPQTTPFEVPNGYFLDFPKKIMQKIDYQFVENEELLPQSLKQLKGKNPFYVPSGYFEKISPFKTPVQPKVIQIASWQKAIRILVAASVVGLLLLIINLDQDEARNVSENETVFESTKLDETTLEGYLKEAEVMETYLDKPMVLQDAETTLIDIDLQTISEKLTEISEKDISLYLEQAG